MVKIQGGERDWGHLGRGNVLVGFVGFVRCDGGVGGVGGEHLGCQTRRWVVVGLVGATVRAMRRISVTVLAKRCPRIRCA